ncbi:CcdB family protein [uncultured Limnobacter sp.]|uniref:CcdB family protein n=1 Tax=uncultured Limnobacter sp. TaxID=199681 RepID=UPI0030FA96D2
MARFDVYSNPGNHKLVTPYLLDVQADLLDGLDSRMVIPLRSMDNFPSVKLPTRLTPVFAIKGKEYLLEVPKMGAVPKRVLKTPVVSLVDEQVTILSALDFLFQGY